MNRLKNFKSFCAKTWALSAPYFRSEDRYKACGLLAAIVALNLGAVYMLVLLNDWNRLFYDALQNRQADVFWQQLGRFTYLAVCFIIIAVYRFYLTQLLEVRWRSWMTDHYLARWLGHHAFYKMEQARFTQPSAQQDATPDNPDQRICEDLNLFTSYTISLSMGFLNAVVTLVSFVGILWSLSGSFAFTWGASSYSIPGFMVWMALLYCGLGSIAAHYIGRSQIKLNFQQQRFEADFRHHLVRVREYSEAIALDKGERVERTQLGLRFSQVLSNYIRLIKAQKNLTWFTSGFGQAAVVFPFIVAAPRYFSGAIQLGMLMQVASAFGRVQDALSWFVDNYASLASWRATTDRLTSFEQAIAAYAQENTELSIVDSETLDVQHLTLALPGGAVLLADVSLHVDVGQSVLLQGPSGSGKSSLFRAFAGIWPFSRGRIARSSDAMFIPQHPYFPNGSLRAALAYPESVQAYSDQDLRQALTDALLGHLVERLDEQNTWGQKLSGGEQQRLAIARVLLKKPKWVFADEATSALDAAAEKTVYERLLELVNKANGAIISIAHRPAVVAFHTQRWELEKVPEGEGALALYQFKRQAPT